MILKILSTVILFLSQSGLSQELLVLEDNRLPGPDSVLIFTPEGLQKGVRHPLVFLLHGLSGNYRQWAAITDLQAEASKYQFIIVCPDGFYDSWYINSPVIKNSQFRSFFFDNLLKTMTSSLNVDTTNIFITGLSMGGFGAMSLFLYNPDVFRAAGSTSGVLDIERFPRRFGMEKIIGRFEEHKERFYALSPMNQLQTASLTGKTLIIDCGTEDLFYDVNQAFYDRCRTLKINAIWISQPGTHGHAYWKESIRQHMFLFSRLVEQ